MKCQGVSQMVVAAILTASLALLTGCDGGNNGAGGSALKGSVNIDGSSTVYPISEAVSEEFGKANKGVRVSVGLSGTGGGFKRFTKGETDISDASRPIKPDEHAKAKEHGVEFVELPIAYDGLSIVVNKENSFVDHLTIDELRIIFLEKKVDGATKTAKSWKEVRDSFPDEPIKIYAPGTDSGTFDYFKEVVVGKGDAAIRGDMSVSEDDNVLVRGVSGEKGAIGFFGCAYYFENKAKLKVVPIDGGKGPIEPTAVTIEDGSYAPFSRPLFIYVSKKSAEGNPAVDAFVKFYLEHGPALAKEVGYVPLPKAVYDRVSKNYADRKTGTQFHDDKGEKVSGPLTEVYK